MMMKTTTPEKDEFRVSQGMRLVGIISELNLKKKEFAQSIAIAESTLSQICKGSQSIQTYHYLLMQLVHGINPHYLKTGRGERFVQPATKSNSEASSKVRGKSSILIDSDSESKKRTRKNAKLVQIEEEEGLLSDAWKEVRYVPVVNSVLKPRNGSWLGSSTGLYAFPSEWLSLKGDPEKLFLLEVTGNSMSPEVCHNDLVLVNQNLTTPRDRDIVVVRINDQLIVRESHCFPTHTELVPKDGGSAIQLLEDHTKVIGKVVWVGRER